jgi:hypothetical protein
MLPAGCGPPAAAPVWMKARRECPRPILLVMAVPLGLLASSGRDRSIGVSEKHATNARAGDQPAKANGSQPGWRKLMRENRVRSILAREGWDSLTIDLKHDYPAAVIMRRRYRKPTPCRWRR